LSYSSSYVAIGRETPVIVFICIAVPFLYEPVLVTWRGQTIGHKTMGFRIIDSATRMNISFSKSLSRFLLKAVFGVVSLLWAFFERRQQFFHDTMTRSMAVMCDIRADQLERLEAGSVVLDAANDRLAAMPSLKRRAVFILLYALGAFILLSIIIDMIFPDCYSDRPLSLEQCYIVETIAGGLLLLLFVSIIIVGLRGGLPGARATRSRFS